MQLYLNHGDSSSNIRLLSVDKPDLTGYAFAPDVEGQFTTLEFESPLLPGYLLHPGQLNLLITFSKNGEITLAPTLYLRDEDPATADEMIFAGDRISSVENPTRMLFSDSLSNIVDLHERKLVLKLELGNVTGYTGSSLTFSKDSYLQPDIREGAEDYGDMIHDVEFNVYQKKEWGILYSEFDVRFTESGEIYHDSIFNGDESGNLYTLFDLYKTDEGDAYHDVDLLDLSTLVNTPRISSLSLGIEDERRQFRGGEFTTLHNLKELADRFDTLPQVITPPEPMMYPEKDYVHISSFVGEPAGYVIEDLLTSGGNFISGDSVKVFSPSSLYGGTYTFRNNEGGSGEWQMPDNFTEDDYYITFPCEPFVSDTQKIGRSSGVWFYLREREVGANVIAYLGGLPGELVSFKELSSEQNLSVWYWRGAAAPFDVTLYFSNPVLNLPGFAGLSAGIVVS